MQGSNVAWNRKYFAEKIKNPYADLVFLACDCSDIPLRDNSVDMVFSNGGFESMRNKMTAGFKDAFRILKPNGKAIYNMSLVDDNESDNTKKWIELYLSLPSSYHNEREYMRDFPQWLIECKRVGFSNNNSIKVYGEMPAPDTTSFPFENEVLQWMACHVLISEK